MRKSKPNNITRAGGVVHIHLAGGLVAIVDAADYPAVKPYHWYANKTAGTTYVKAETTRGWQRSRLLLHRVILGPLPASVDVDHHDGNGLNNTRANISVATRSQNNANRKRMVSNTSGYVGVTRYAADKTRWQAQIRVDYNKLYLGVFTTAAEAAVAYNQAAVKLFGKFARLNKIE